MTEIVAGHARVSPVRPWVVRDILTVDEHDGEWWALSEGNFHFHQCEVPILAQATHNETDLPGAVLVAIVSDDLFEFYPDQGECERIGIPIDDSFKILA